MNRRRYRPRGLYLGLALLTFCAVFAATAGAREALASRTQAVRQTVAATTPRPGPSPSRPPGATCRASSPTTTAPTRDARSCRRPRSTRSPRQLHADFNRAPVRLTPAGTDWSSITIPFNPVNGDLPGTGGTPVKIEVTERQPLGPQVRLLSGRLPGRHAHVRPAVAGTGPPGRSRRPRRSRSS